MKIFDMAVCLSLIAFPLPGWGAAQSANDTPQALYEQGMKYAMGSVSADGKSIVGRDYAEAARLVRQAADRGYARAQKSLGDFYFNGLGVKKDEEEAARWFQKAADQGDAGAESSLGSMYADGIGVKQDLSKALDLLQKGASHGDAAGQFRLASLYAKGQGVAREPAVALEWYRRAAAQNFAPAEFALGTAYEVGFGGFEMSLDQAASWYARAVSHGLEQAKAALDQVTTDPAPSTRPQPATAELVQADLLFSPRPAYPPEARASRAEDSVVLQAVITKTGRVRELKILRGNPLFNESVLAAVRQWRYRPQLLNGQPTEVITTISVNFSLVN